MILNGAAWTGERESFNSFWSKSDGETVALKEQRSAFSSFFPPSLSEKRVVQHLPCYFILLLTGMTTVVQSCFLLHL